MRLKEAFPNMGNSLRSELEALESEGVSETKITESSSGKYNAGTMHAMPLDGSKPPISDDNPI